MPHPCHDALLRRRYVQAFRRECDQLPPLAAMHYLNAALARPDIKAALPKIRCRLLLIYGGEALYKADCIELATLVNKERFAISEVLQVCAPTGPCLYHAAASGRFHITLLGARCSQ